MPKIVFSYRLIAIVVGVGGMAPELLCYLANNRILIEIAISLQFVELHSATCLAVNSDFTNHLETVRQFLMAVAMAAAS